MSYLDLNMRLPELLLMRVDKMSMGVSLEGRVPFLDHKFVELAMSIPASVKTRGGVLKYILKKAVRGVIPDELIDRKKQGFGVPVSEWFMAKLGPYVRQELAKFCRHTDFLDSKRVLEFIAHKENGTQAWYLLNFALWWNEYIGCISTAEDTFSQAESIVA
jgi:asparagine synthase (glutamine-hydrolysing)